MRCPDCGRPLRVVEMYGRAGVVASLACVGTGSHASCGYVAPAHVGYSEPRTARPSARMIEREIAQWIGGGASHVVSPAALAVPGAHGPKH